MDLMHAVAPDLLLRLWEQVQGLPPHRQAEEILATAEPGLTREAIAALGIGGRDARLLTLRKRLFGPQLTSLADCPNCGERVEMGFPVDEICAAATASGTQPDPSGPLRLIEQGWRVEYRLPTGADIAEITQVTDLDIARRELLRRCLLAAVPSPDDAGSVLEDGQGSTGGPGLERLPAALLERVVEAMSAADPQADVELLLSCPACGHQWQATFDIVSYLVAEIGAWARRVLADVARLARGYGWREADILAMTPARRQAYLELLEGL